MDRKSASLAPVATAAAALPAFGPVAAGRKAVGLLMLSAALLLAVVVPAVLAPDVAGTASRVHIPEPPPTGSCLRGAELDVVGCGEPHEFEVTQTWTALSKTKPVQDSECWLAADAYIGVMPASFTDIWYQPLLSYDIAILDAPASQTVAGLGWVVCVIEPPLGGTAVGSIADLPDQRSRPGAFGSCVRIKSDLVDFGGQTACSAQHDAEILATSWQFVPDDAALAAVGLKYGMSLPDEDELQNLCTEMAADLLNSGDPTAAGQLMVELQYLPTPGSMPSEEIGSTGESEISGTNINVVCYVRPAGDRTLIDSVVGLGEKPVPFG